MVVVKGVLVWVSGSGADRLFVLFYNFVYNLLCRRKNRQKKNSDMMDQMRQDKLIRAMNVQSSAFANRIIHNEKDFSFSESTRK